MQPTKEETTGGGPFLAKFIRPGQQPPPQPAPPSAPTQPTTTGIVDAEGNVYDEAD
jgi:hypothetical protein